MKYFSKNKNRIRDVKRITVDEILAEDLVRFEVCDLKEDVRTFLYEIDVWERGKIYVSYGETYQIELDIPYNWNMLEEGNVFISGTFRIIGDRDDPEKFRVNKKYLEFIKIDHLDTYRDYVRELYTKALVGGSDSVK
jgi:hypothetical protein